MRLLRLRLLLLLLLLPPLLLLLLMLSWQRRGLAVPPPPPPPPPPPQPPRPHDGRREAFVTLVSSESYLLGARVLGARLRAMARDGGWRARDLLLLTTVDLDAETRGIMQAEGWRVATVEPVANPFAQPGDVKANRVFTKLRIWERRPDWPAYDRLLYLDVDVLPVDAAAVDALFGCAGSFCATPSSSHEVHFGAMNTGVIVLQPSAPVFAELELARHGITGSYNRGDQGFLNVFFGTYCKGQATLQLAAGSRTPCEALAASPGPPIDWHTFGAQSRPQYAKLLSTEWAPAAEQRANQTAAYMNTLASCDPAQQLHLCEYSSSRPATCHVIAECWMKFSNNGAAPTWLAG
jgi:hypothetical protein